MFQELLNYSFFVIYMIFLWIIFFCPENALKVHQTKRF